MGRPQRSPARAGRSPRVNTDVREASPATGGVSPGGTRTAGRWFLPLPAACGPDAGVAPWGAASASRPDISNGRAAAGGDFGEWPTIHSESVCTMPLHRIWRLAAKPWSLSNGRRAAPNRFTSMGYRGPGSSRVTLVAATVRARRYNLAVDGRPGRNTRSFLHDRKSPYGVEPTLHPA